ncbi:phBC6A51 family helix-turn-helix protein [Candidatus Enterococcus ferrettii]|uniref:Homeodomain phBC6A51-type domain-containing protein n=1 Tax=Candidatus Enterococcus ferrettii TaxID=2815324 RepID=A0ABV0EI66_9ENTE|nr:phBC6A51 family helix-turn-helix protein [Enterococcus sp. 665A]MBO1341880.1 hypothetical protein [Enterococcus sp. 665A]
MSEVTKSDKYRPTAAEKKLLEVLINPEYVGDSITSICKAANVSRKKYYDAMGKEAFVNLVNETTMDLIKGKASDVLNATYKYALKEKGHQDRKLILTIAGIYTDKQEIEHSGGIDVRKQYEEMSDEDLEALVKRYEKINDS